MRTHATSTPQNPSSTVPGSERRYPTTTKDQWKAGISEREAYHHKIIARILLAISLCAVFLLTAHRASADEVIQPATGTGGLICIACSTPEAVGQTFTTISAGTISTILVSLDDEGTNPTDNLTLNLFLADGSGDPTGSSLGTAAITMDNTLACASSKTFTFASPVAVTATTQYIAVFTRASPSGTNYAVVCGTNSDVYAGGKLRRKDTGTWTNTGGGARDGNLLITGLPFTVGNAYNPVSIRSSLITFADFIMGYCDQGTTTIVFEETTNAGTVTRITDADFSNTSSIMVSFSYKV